MSSAPVDSARLSKSFAIVTPVLDDWQSLDRLLEEISLQMDLQRHAITVVAVDDGSTERGAPSIERISGPVRRIVVVRLRANQSHQRAIALGLAYVHRELPDHHVIVMDSDGEDRPQELAGLIAAHVASPGSIIVAQRRKRSEGMQFRAGYIGYKALFALLTGKQISFGNFCLVPSGRLDNVLFNTNIWNNFAATVLRSRVPLQFVETDRGVRYFGKSRMNFTSLMVHGLSAIAVFSDMVISRMMIALVGMLVLFAVSIVGVVGMKLVVDYYQIPGLFIPGYATSVILSLTNILVSSLFVGLMVILSLLASRNQVSALPSRLFDDLVGDIDIVGARTSPVAAQR